MTRFSPWILLLLSIVVLACCDSDEQRAKNSQISKSPPYIGGRRAISRKQIDNSGLASIAREDLQQHIEFLASDALRGRKAASQDEEVTVAYIASHFRKSGLTPLHGSLVQKVPVKTARFDYGKSRCDLVLKADRAQKFQLKDDLWVFSATPKKDTFTIAPLVFVGYGISAPEYGYDDYADVNVHGKAVVYLSGEPQSDNPSVFLGKFPTIYSTLHAKAVAAQEHGAVAAFQIFECNSDWERWYLAEVQRLYKINKRMDQFLKEASQEPMMSIVDNPLDIPVFISYGKLAAVLYHNTALRVSSVQGEINRTLQTKSFLVEDIEVQLELKWKDVRESTVKNVVGLLPGTNDKSILIGAHHDHEGVKQEKIYNGADDNASGIAAVLELAEAFQQARRTTHSIVFVAWGGEEQGLIGSQFYVQNPLFPLKNTEFVINLDMIGRNGSSDEKEVIESQQEDLLQNNVLFISGPKYTPKIKTIVEAANSRIGLSLSYDSDYTDTLFRSDSFFFAHVGIPVICYHTGKHADYHEPTDTIEKINFTKLHKIVQHVYQTVQQIAGEEKH